MMLEFIVLGSGFAFAAAISPGPLQAFLFSSVAQKGWKRTLPAAFAPLISDGPVIVLVLLILSRFPATIGNVLQIAGGAFLLYLAWLGYKDWTNTNAESFEAKAQVPGTLAKAITVNLLNPNVYISWSLVLAPALIRAWNQAPANAAAFLIAFYGTMVTVTASTILLFGTTSFLGPNVRRQLILASAIALAGLGVYQFTCGLLNVIR